jgi:hypothetical protein
MTSKKNFSNQATPSIVDTEYHDCNFTHTNPVQDGALWKGNRLFPGDDTPRTFVNCNLRNCEPPPGSTIIGCHCAITRPEVFVSSSNDIEIDGETITINHYNRIVYGRYTSSGYEYFPSPKEYPFDREAD